MNRSLFDPIQLGSLQLQNRIVMAPMTRNRASLSGLATESMAVYYGQRSSAGLIITEGTQPSALGQAYPRTPGMYTQAHAQAWAKVTDVVHRGGAKIFLQIMHAGRLGHPLNNGNQQPAAPSAVRVNDGSQIFTDAAGLQDFVKPRELTTDEIEAVVDEHAWATRLAIQAGFDGVELHVTSGYLVDQFLCSNTNLRDDKYGAGLPGRIQFAQEALQAMLAEAGANRVGLRVSPGAQYNDMHDAQPLATHEALIATIASLPLAYLHVGRVPDLFPIQPHFDQVAALRKLYKGTLITTGNYSPTLASQAIANGDADLIGFGRLFIANPQLVARLRDGLTLAQADHTTFYTATNEGYTDYPA